MEKSDRTRARSVNKHQKALGALQRYYQLSEPLSACASAMLDTLDYTQSFNTTDQQPVKHQPANHTPKRRSRMDTRSVKGGSVARTKTQRRKPRVDSHYYVNDIAQQLNMNDTIIRGDNFIGAHDISAIMHVTASDLSSVGAVCSTMLYDELSSRELHDCVDIGVVPRSEPDGMRVATPIKPTPVSTSRMDTSSDTFLTDRDSFTNITMLSDPQCPVPENSPNSSFSDDAAMDNIVNSHSASLVMQLGPRPACIGQESDSDLLCITGSSGYSSDSDSPRREPMLPPRIPVDTNSIVDATVYENFPVRDMHQDASIREVKNKKNARRMDITMCSDMTAFMDKPLCRQGVVKESKMTHKQKKSIAHKLKKFGKKIHGIGSSSSLQTLAVL